MVDLDGLRRRIETHGLDVLTVDDITAGDLPALKWSGGPGHLRNIAGRLERAASGEIEYIALRSPDGTPVAKLCIDYSHHEGAGEIMQVATHEVLQRLGLATRLLGAAEERIRSRGVRWAVLGVEDDNPDARRLYERLGYERYGRETASWDAEDEDGNTYLHETEFEMLRKALLT